MICPTGESFVSTVVWKQANIARERSFRQLILDTRYSYILTYEYQESQASQHSVCTCQVFRAWKSADVRVLVYLVPLDIVYDLYEYVRMYTITAFSKRLQLS